MNLVTLIKLVPDTVEELCVTPDQKSLDPEWLRYKLSDPDDHALEQALLLKEKHGGTVQVIALESPELDEVLFSALAKGADRAVQLAGDFSQLQSFGAAQLLADYLQPPGGTMPPDTLILLRSQSIDDLEGEVGPFIADLLGIPYVGVVTGVAPKGGEVVVTKEFAGGVRGEFTVSLPAVLGIQSAERPPRYVPIAKLRNVMKTAKIERVEAAPVEAPARLCIERMYKPEAAGHAQMIEGAPEEVSAKIVEILATNHLI